MGVFHVLPKDKRIELLALGQALRAIRKDRQLTQERLSEISRVDRSYISEVENGEKSPSFLVILSLTRALGISPVTLMEQFEQQLKGFKL
ncbi:helix-turn-helix domain-containing protein [Gorillibacterium sp. sgz500922]|uniref:helix-turn-helix domain-containing protein n=1 Tax=Gorillibacterium sp. sgz500922 TaxID=3446694 RepID=UPI003F67FFC6